MEDQQPLTHEPDLGDTINGAPFYKKKSFIIAIVSIVVAIIAVILIIIFVGGKKEEEKDENKYSFKAIYEIKSENENINLINILPHKDQIYSQLTEMKINGEKINPTKNYTFASKGNYTVLFLLDINNADSFSKMFEGIKNLVTINFYQKFNTEKIKYMDYMFRNCESLSFINISYFNTENVIAMNHMFASCTSLTSINLQKLNFNNLQTIE